ncbi:thiosulfate sulfurtransferase 18 [Amaranthus tricolor]|uniref:thiosulfate sulfurtransferase 18 n=1 Tax=Amaranthus tricolor TaxID=29722 RepID=UPI002584A38C|nr:thiosulfate sulfurtransferase 18 [Amaranthus tricolor]
MGITSLYFSSFFIFCLLFLPLFCISELPQIVTIDVHAASHLLRSGHSYIDVRTKEEFNKGHVDVDNCFNIPYFFITSQGRVKNPEFLKQVSLVFNKDDHIIVGCQSGVRSIYATTDLLESGFKHVSNMGGGYVSWVENELSIKESKQEL